MKTILNKSIFTSLLMVAISATASSISFNIEGVNSNNGKLFVALYKGEEGYESGNPVKYDAIPAKEGTVSVIFNDVEQGEYAIQVFHDENNDGKMGKNFIGMPTEGYGFSNNAQPNYGPASYNDMKFTVEKAGTTVNNNTTLIY